MRDDHEIAVLEWFGDRCLRIALRAGEPAEVERRVHAAADQLAGGPIEGLIDVVPAAATVLVVFEPMRLDPARAVAGVRAALSALDCQHRTAPARLVEIPACYEGAHAPDLESLCELSGLSAREVIQAHSGAEYTVSFVGFVPGFAYLRGLPKAIEAPRHESPRARVPAGSIGIAGDQTGVYPSVTPGGWRLIGRTPRHLFDARRARPSLLEPGDRVRFVPISASEFERLAQSAGGVP